MRWASTGAAPTAIVRAWRNGSAAALDVVGGHGLEHVAGARPPHPDHGRLGAGLAQRHALAVAAVQAQPAEVGVDDARAGHDPEPVVGEARHGDVGDDPAAAVAPLRVDDAPGRPVDPVHAHALEQRGRVGPLDRDLAERGHVDDADPLAEGRVLGGQALVLGRPRQAVSALVGAGAPPRPPGPVVVGPLPAVLGAVHGAQILRAPVHRREPAGPAPLGGVERVAQPVVVPVGLAARPPRVRPGGRTPSRSASPGSRARPTRSRRR